MFIGIPMNTIRTSTIRHSSVSTRILTTTIYSSTSTNTPPTFITSTRTDRIRARGSSGACGRRPRAARDLRYRNDERWAEPEHCAERSAEVGGVAEASAHRSACQVSPISM